MSRYRPASVLVKLAGTNPYPTGARSESAKIDNWNFRKNGDHLNLDVKKTILQSGLIIEEMKTVIFDTHYLVKAKPLKSS